MFPVQYDEHTTYSVVYRSGGTHRCTWTRILAQFTTSSEANLWADGIERQGYKALVFKTDELNRIGLPIGWEPGTVDFDRDLIEIKPCCTFHSRKVV